jgi:hypothetical protein
MKRSLVFVIGPPRSGTTLLLDLLREHPAVAAVSEEFHRFHHDLGLFPHRHGESDHFRLTARDALPELRAAYAAAIEAAAGDKPCFLVKISTLSLQVDFIRALFPEARIVQIVRDGRDTVCSMEDLRQAYQREQETPRLLGPAPDPLALEVAERFAAEPHIRGAAAWAYHVTRSHFDLRFAGFGRSLRLRYEDLLADPFETVQRALTFLELPPAAEVERALVDVSDVPRGAQARGFSTSEASGKRLRRFERDLRPELRTVIAPLLEAGMRIMGYDADPVPSRGELTHACNVLHIHPEAWQSLVERERDWVALHERAFAPQTLLRQSDVPTATSKPLLIDGASFGIHSQTIDGRVAQGHAWVQKQDRRYTFADPLHVWPSIAARMDGAHTAGELAPSGHREEAFAILERLHGLGFVSYV